MTLILTIMTAAAAVFLLALLLRVFDQKGASAAARDSDHPSDLEKVTAADPMDSDHAETARADIKRRRSAADRDLGPVAVRFSFDGKNFAAGAFAGIFVLGLAGLYTLNDNKDPSSGSVPTRAAREPGASAVEQLAAATFAQDTEGQPQSPSQARLGTVDEMVGRLVERLDHNPKDPEGWRMLGWSYFNTERFVQSAAAYGKAIALNPESAELRSARGEALVRAADGLVTDEASAEFGQALRLDAKDLRGRFFMGLVKEQTGNKIAALDDWVAILNDTDTNDAWVSDLMQRVTELGQETGIDVSARLRRPKPATTGGLLDMLQQQQTIPAVAVPKNAGPDAEDARNAEVAMVQGMVDRLASRLTQSPRDVDGWIKLMRSRQVLGEAEGAEQTFRFALDIFKDAPREQERISAAARELGLIN